MLVFTLPRTQKLSDQLEGGSGLRTTLRSFAAINIGAKPTINKQDAAAAVLLWFSDRLASYGCSEAT